MTLGNVQIGKLDIGLQHPPRIMGVINLSPESFYQGSIANPDDLIKYANTLVSDGADLIDLGGASTAPKKTYNTRDVQEQDELARIVEAMDILGTTLKVPISIDTSSSVVAQTSIELGASIINDVTGLQGDEMMPQVIADTGVYLILMAHCANGCQSVDLSIRSLQKSLDIAHKADIDPEKIIIDPGIGFGKPAEVDFDIIARINRFLMLDHPLLIGVSRKAFIGECLNEPNPEYRLNGTIAVTAIAVEKGVSIIRAHDVKEAHIAAAIGHATRKGKPLQEGKVRLVLPQSEKDVTLILHRIGVGTEIRKSLAKKGVMVNILLHDVKVPAALILKQEMLALGGEAAYHYDTIDASIMHTDVLLMGTPQILAKLVRKTGSMDYFGVKALGKQIEQVLNGRIRGM